MSNHIEEAKNDLQTAHYAIDHMGSSESIEARLLITRTEALVAIAEQLRIANLIALGSNRESFGTAVEATQAIETSQWQGYLRQYALQPDIAEALGIGGGSDD